jgi:hypothetical protein
MMLIWPGDLSAPHVLEWATRVLAKPAKAGKVPPKEAAERTLARLAQRSPPGGYWPEANNAEDAPRRARWFVAKVLYHAWEEEKLASIQLKPPGSDHGLLGTGDFSDANTQRDVAEMLETMPYSPRAMRRLGYPTTIPETAALRKKGELARTHRQEGALTLNQMFVEYGVTRGKLRVAVARAVANGAIPPSG